MARQTQKRVFHYETASNAAPFVSDIGMGSVEAVGPMAALKGVVRKYDHPAGLFAAVVKEPTPENSIRARFLSARAATQEGSPCGLTEWREDGLYVDGKKMPERREVYKLVR